MLIFIILLISIALLQYFFHFWWLAMLLPFVFALLFYRNAWKAFFAGFFAVALVWFAYSFLLNLQNEGLLAGKMAELFSLPDANYMLIVTTILGAIIGGFGGLAGFSLKSVWLKKERKFK